MKSLATIVLLALASPCLAGPWIGASGSYNTYAMDAVNDDIGRFNQAVAPISVDEIKSGIGFGVSLGTDVDRWSLSIGYDRLPASTSVDGNSSPIYDLAGNTVLGRAAYRLPLNAKFGVLAGVGAGVLFTSGHIGDSGLEFANKTGPSTNAIIFEGGVGVSGTAFCYEGFVEGDVPLGGKFSLVPSVGYRAAKVDAESENTGGTVITRTVDYTGMAAHLGVRFAL